MSVIKSEQLEYYSHAFRSNLSPICECGVLETWQVSQSHFIKPSPPHVDNTELHAQVPATSPHCQSR